MSIPRSTVSISWILVLVLMWAGPASVRAETKVPPELEQRVEAARQMVIQILERLVQTDEREQVEAALKEAHGFALFLNVRQAGVIVSSITGTGVLALRDQDGEWNPLVILRVEGLNVGPHMRAQSGDTLLLLKTPGAVQRFLSGAGTQLGRGT